MIIVSLLEDNQNWSLSTRKPSSWKPAATALNIHRLKDHAKSQIYGAQKLTIFSNGIFPTQLIGVNQPTKTSVKHHVPGNSAGDLFGMVKWPFSMVKWPTTFGDEKVTLTPKFANLEETACLLFKALVEVQHWQLCKPYLNWLVVSRALKSTSAVASWRDIPWVAMVPGTLVLFLKNWVWKNGEKEGGYIVEVGRYFFVRSGIKMWMIRCFLLLKLQTCWGGIIFTTNVLEQMNLNQIWLIDFCWKWLNHQFSSNLSPFVWFKGSRFSHRSELGHQWPEWPEAFCFGSGCAGCGKFSIMVEEGSICRFQQGQQGSFLVHDLTSLVGHRGGVRRN